jgi:CHASE3 domain sensor protein
MPEPKRSEVLAANRRGAYVLALLLVAIVAVAIAISIRIYKQLDSAAAIQETLVAAQQDLDAVIAAQVNLQTTLRGYVATGEAEFRNPYETFSNDFSGKLADFERVTRSLDIDRLGATIKEMRDLHAEWDNQVARPLLRDRRIGDAPTREILGKVYVDQLRSDTVDIRRLLEERLGYSQLELKHRIDEGLLGGIASIVVFGFVSIVFVASRVLMQDVIDRERSIVETLGGAFRTDLDHLPGARIGTAYLSADRDAAIGGDLYDVRRLDPGRGLVLIADVSGKGIEAAVNTAFVKYTIRALARRLADPAAILEEFNRMFLETVADPNLFVVGFVGMLDTRGRTLTYASAGHSGAYLRRSAVVRPLEVTGPIIGLDPSFSYDCRTLNLEHGDLIMLATDGLSEARDRRGVLLGDSGAMSLLAASTVSEPQACADRIVAAVRARGGGVLHDDLALLIIAIDGEAAAAR